VVKKLQRAQNIRARVKGHQGIRVSGRRISRKQGIRKKDIRKTGYQGVGGYDSRLYAGQSRSITTGFFAAPAAGLDKTIKLQLEL
jgi:hypothetical protein